MPSIELKFNIKTGETRVEAQGFSGSSCEQATKFLRDSLGSCTDFQQKAEWFQSNLELSGSLNTNFCG
jgi:hypothetical protein